MSDIQLYLLEVDKNKPEARKIAAQSASKLANKELKLIDLITSLEAYINNKDDAAIRGKSVAYLADCLESLPLKVLSGQDRRLLCDFILGRIEGDTEGIGASARVLSALESRGKWDHDTAQRVAKTFLNHANPLKGFRLQTDRFAVIQLFDLLIGKYRQALKDLNDGDPEFLGKFIYFFDGEKDPRNLMMVFSILQVPMTEWELGAYVQDLFDAVFNYFPITFKPPPDDPYGITAQDLKDRLRECIAANSEFAPHAFPALLDKLDSTSMNTKRDVLQALQACIVNYSATTINLYSVTLWDALKFEILNVQEEDLAEGALKALSLMAGKFALQEGPLNAYLRPIIKEGNEHLEDAPSKQSLATGRILYSVCSSATPVADKIAKGVIPTLSTLYQSSESMTKRRGLLEVFNEIVRSYLDRYRLQPKLNLEALQRFAPEALGFMLRALSHAPKAEVSFRLAALSGASQLVALRGLLTSDQTYQAVDAVTDIVLHEHIEGHGDIRVEAITALTGMAHSAPDAIRDRAVPSFMVELPDAPPDDVSYLSVLEAFAQLSGEQQVFDTVVRRLKNKHSSARASGASEAYQEALLLAILYTFTNGSPMPDEEGILRSTYYTEYVEPFTSSLDPAATGKRTIEIIGRLCNIILRPQGVHFQNQVHSKYLADKEARTTNTATLLDAPQFSLYYYAALRPEVVEGDETRSILRKQAHIARDSQTTAADFSFALQHISLFLNKFVNRNAMEETLGDVGVEVPMLLASQSTPQTISIVFAVVTALLVQGKCPALISKYLQLLLDQLPAPSGRAIATRFATLLAPNELLTKANHCRVSGLFKQKAFSELVPALTSAIKTADTSTKPNYLIALSGILRWLPYAVLQPSLSTLVGPLMQMLDLSSEAAATGKKGSEVDETKASTLTILEAVLMHDPNVLNEHTNALVSRLLGCSTPPGTAVSGSTATAGNSANVRTKALQCLALVPQQLKRENVLPLRRQVVKRLVGSLDDGRRAVRAEGVKCRGKWLGLDEGVEDDD